MRLVLRSLFGAVLMAGFCVGAAMAAEKVAGLDQTGRPELKSAGPLAFGPEGVLFVGDPQGAALFAIGVERSAPVPSPKEFRFEAVDQKLAALLRQSDWPRVRGGPVPSGRIAIARRAIRYPIRSVSTERTQIATCRES